MKARQLAVWSAPGEVARSGVVVDPGKSGARKVLVQWDDGERVHVQKKDPAIVFVPEGSILAKWALNIGELEDLLRTNPAGAFRIYLQEQPESVTERELTRAVEGLGFPHDVTDDAWQRAKPVLRADAHIAAHGRRYQWSDQPIDPHAKLRSLDPEGALQRLLKGRLSEQEKQVLVEVIRSGFR
jgi:hypothetical protein